MNILDINFTNQYDNLMDL